MPRPQPAVQLDPVRPPQYGDISLAERFTINLDYDLEDEHLYLIRQRWGEVVTTYSEQLKIILKDVEALVPKEISNSEALNQDWVEKNIPFPYNYEIIGIADCLKVEVRKIVLVNLLYEVRNNPGTANACTSIIAQARNRSITHGRNLDYFLWDDWRDDLLRIITITVDFQKGGETVYTGTTFAGYVGLLTGQTCTYTISLNERTQLQKGRTDILAALVDGKKVAAFHIRNALDKNFNHYKEALSFLADETSEKPLIRSSYIIIGGANEEQGAIITRDSKQLLDQQVLNVANEKWYLLVTNVDPWKDTEDPRRKAGIADMESMGMASGERLSGHADMLRTLSKRPILNKQTLCTVVMAAEYPHRYTTFIRNLAGWTREAERAREPELAHEAERTQEAERAWKVQNF